MRRFLQYLRQRNHLNAEEWRWAFWVFVFLLSIEGFLRLFFWLSP